MNELEKIRDILNRHIGKTNKVTSSQIADQIGIKEDDTHAKTRALIFETAKKYKLPLAANNRGYFLINTKAEYDEYIKNLDSRIAGIEERKRIITDNYKEKK